MKEKQLRDSITCALCGKPFGSCQSPFFYRVHARRFAVDFAAVQRQTGLATMLGSAALAQHMGPDEDMAKEMDERSAITICDACASRPVSVEQLCELSPLVKDEQLDTSHQ